MALKIKIGLVLLFAFALGVRAEHHDLNLGFVSGMSYSSISRSFYPESSLGQSNSFWGLELEYGLTRLYALSVGISHAGRGASFEKKGDINYSYWDIPIAFVHHLPLNKEIRISFRAGITSSMLGTDDEKAPATSLITSAIVGVGISYEFLFECRMFLRGEYMHSLNSLPKETNAYFRTNGKLSEGRVVLGVSYNLNPDPLQKKQHKIPNCLK